jgi:DNA-binding NtrC family response regulator
MTDPVKKRRGPPWLPLVEDLAKSPTTPVLLIGRDASKVARRLHRLTFVGKKSAPFVDIDCTWLRTDGLMRVLFGSETSGRVERGLFEQADGGTLFLDGVTDLPNEAQARLVGLLDSGTFHRNGGMRPVVTTARIVASTEGDVVEALKRGRLRHDLHTRLDVFPILVG